MNRNRLDALPTLLYIAMLVAVWLYSWVGGLVTLFRGGAVDILLASADGVRWFVRTSADNFAALPFGSLLLLLMACGVLHKSGLFSQLAALARGTLSGRGRRALVAALVATSVCALFLFLSTLYPLNLSRSVSGTLGGSPLSDGFLSVLFAVLFIVSLVFGVVYGTYKSVDDVIDGLACRIKFHAGSFVALLPASMLLASMEYSGLTAAVFPSGAQVFEYAVVLFPFVFRLLFAKDA